MTSTPKHSIRGCAVWLTGLPSSGKTTLAKAICSYLNENYNCAAYNVDGDHLRSGLNSDLGFTDEDRRENIRRAAEISKMIAEAGVVCVASFISPFEEGRQNSRLLHEKAGIPFYEVYLSTPLEICCKRDVKGLYAKALRSELNDFTGLTSRYERPEHSDLVIDTSELPVDECVRRIFEIISIDKCLSIRERCKPKANGLPLLDAAVCNNSNGEELSRDDMSLSAADGSSFTQMMDSDVSTFEKGDNCLNINKVDVQWIQTIADGWTDPLKGFMREKDYLECLHFRSISREGKHYSQSMPVILVCSIEDKERLKRQERLALIYEGVFIANLENPEFYEFRKEEHCSRLFGTLDPNHPGIQQLNNLGEYIVGGELSDVVGIKWNDGLDKYRLSAMHIREQLKNMKADSVIAFQLRNPLHNGHVLLIEEAKRKLKRDGYKNVVVLLHPLGGWTKDDDVPLGVRMKQHETLLEHCDWKSNTILAIFPSPMLYAGPVEVQWHAKARMVANVTHYIVGRDPAGVPHPTKGGYLYDPRHGAQVLSLTPHLEKLTILPFPVVAMCRSSGRMEFYDESRSDDFEFISGTKMRAYARENREPPKGFMHHAAWEVLAQHYRMNNAC